MQLKKFFIANAGVNVLVIINANAAAMAMIVGNVVRCMIIDSHHIATLIGTLNLFTIKQIHNKTDSRHYQLRERSASIQGLSGWSVFTILYIMKRYIIHLKNQNYIPKQANWLLNRARNIVSDIGVVVRDTRVATEHVEFDTSVPERSDIEEILRRFNTISPLLEYELLTERQMEKHEAIRKAKDLFNNEKYWQTHEVLEPVWKGAHGEEKDLLNGIILIAAAFVHDEKDESSICISILSRAKKKLSQSKGLYFGMDLDEINREVLRIIETGMIRRFTI